MSKECVMETRNLPMETKSAVKFKNNHGVLAPHTPPGETKPYLERVAQALGVKDKDCAAMLMSQLPVANYKFTPGNAVLINGLVAAVSEINPRDPVESMLAAQMVSCHTQVMRLLEKVATKDLAADLTVRYLRLADRLARTYARQMEVLSSYRRKGSQKMTVEHITINDGGQAIVGNIEDRRGAYNE
jgi:hypothetical protein